MKRRRAFSRQLSAISYKNIYAKRKEVMNKESILTADFASLAAKGSKRLKELIR
ncbi:MAG: hypothetical protein JXA73_16385 [Acidobacteria bacterium]|nr:hypothetical protein [Acidobacteriota bacterium]